MADTKFLLAGMAICAVLFSTSAEAKLYKWVDDNGETHYSSTIPPEYAGHKHTELDKSGRVVQDRSKDEKADNGGRKTAEEQAAIEQRRKDKALLASYANEQEIDLARGRNLQQVDARINSIKIRLDAALATLNAHQQDKARREKAGKKIPTYLREDLADDEAKVQGLQQQMDQAKEQQAAIKARYDADKARYRELTGKGSRE